MSSFVPAKAWPPPRASLSRVGQTNRRRNGWITPLPARAADSAWRAFSTSCAGGVSVDDAQQSDDRGLVRGDAVEVAHAARGIVVATSHRERLSAPSPSLFQTDGLSTYSLSVTGCCLRTNGRFAPGAVIQALIS